MGRHTGNAPKRGLVLWGENDPFGPVEGGRSWADTYGFPFVQVDDAGHWVIAERPESIAPTLTKHWQP